MSDIDNQPFLKLSYATGSKYYDYAGPITGFRNNPMNVLTAQTEDRNKIIISAVPHSHGLNGAEDIMVHARGPWAHIFSGSYEQNYIAHAIKYASCLDNYCESGAKSVVASVGLIIVAVLLKFF